ncbi:MAG: hypothetical protein RIS70_158, partial [Planctomycetota bacterium]
QSDVVRAYGGDDDLHGPELIRAMAFCQRRLDCSDRRLHPRAGCIRVVVLPARLFYLRACCTRVPGAS